MTDIEQRLIKAARDGEWLECAEPDNVVRAGLIRELLRGDHGALDPAGIRLEGARIEGTLHLGQLKATTGLIFSDCEISEPIEARSARLPSLAFFGGECAGMYADGLQVDGDLYLRNGVHVTGHDERGTIRLLGGQVGGDLELQGAVITNTASTALDISDIKINGHLFLRDGVQITGQGHEGAFALDGAHIALNVELVETEITNSAGPAVKAENVRIGGRLALGEGNQITGQGTTGAISLIGAHISRHFDLSHTKITNTAGIALDANGVQIGGSLFVRDEVHITGHDKTCTVDLDGCRIGNNLEFNDAEITNTAGPATTASRAQIGGALLLLGRTTFSAGGDEPALVLIGTQVSGRFGCQETVAMSVKSNAVLDLRDMTVGAAATLPHAALCPDPGRDRKCGSKRLVGLNGFTYASLGSGWDWGEWLHLVRFHAPAYHASAYQWLAAVERAAGHDGTVRRILMAQQTDLRRRSPQSLGGPLTRWFHWLWGVLAGYGYRARRTAAALLLVLVVAGAIGWWAGQVDTRPGHHVAERVTTAGVPCSTVELVGLGLDRGLPLAMTGMRTRCDLDTASKKGQAFTAAIWLVQLAVWGLATLALAGYTNLVRKPG